MKSYFVVHGFVQGVGYRYFVKRMANRHKVKGMVKNMQDGSVVILADADPSDLQEFEKEINVSMRTGPQVKMIERYDEDSDQFPKDAKYYDKFVIVKD